MNATELRENLNHFTGTENYHRWSMLFRKCVLTDGTKFLAENAQCYWLMDAIASHIPTAARADQRCRSMQFATLKKNDDKTAILTIVADKGEKPVVEQHIDYTDFPLDEIQVWVSVGGTEQDGMLWVLMLPSEY